MTEKEPIDIAREIFEEIEKNKKKKKKDHDKNSKVSKGEWVKK